MQRGLIIIGKNYALIGAAFAYNDAKYIRKEMQINNNSELLSKVEKMDYKGELSKINEKIEKSNGCAEDTPEENTCPP